MALRGPVREERRYDSKLTEGALVLEGGSLRSVFTAGVLDTLLEHEIRLSYVNGVSACSALIKNICMTGVIWD